MLPQHERFFSETQRQIFNEAKAKGIAEGRVEGRLEGAAHALLRILGGRGLVVSAEQQERILACTDLATLERWLDRALTAATTADALAP